MTSGPNREGFDPHDPRGNLAHPSQDDRRTFSPLRFTRARSQELHPVLSATHSIRSASCAYVVGRRQTATRPLARLASRLGLAALVFVSINASGLLPDLSAFSSGPQASAPVSAVAPTWSNTDSAWWSQLAEPSGEAVSQRRVYRMVAQMPSSSHEPPEERLRQLIDYGSPVVYRSASVQHELESEPSGEQRVLSRFGRSLQDTPRKSSSIPSGDWVLSVENRQALNVQWFASVDWRHQDLFPIRPPAHLTLAQSRQALEDAVAHTELAALRVPLPYWRSPSTVWRLAKAIEQADRELSVLSGWSGHPLGLHGRVVLTLGVPGDSTTSLDERGYIHINSDWPSLAHEWFHGVDFAMAPDLLEWPSRFQTFSFQRAQGLRVPALGEKAEQWREAWGALWDRLRHPPLDPLQRRSMIPPALSEAAFATIHQTYPSGSEAGLGAIDREIWADPVRAVPASGSPWLTWRAQAAQVQRDHDRPSGWLGYFSRPSHMATYLGADEELLAFSFDGQAQIARPLRLLSSATGSRAYVGPPGYRPLPQESIADIATWKAFFLETNSWWQTDGRTRTPPPVLSSTALRPERPLTEGTEGLVQRETPRANGQVPRSSTARPTPSHRTSPVFRFKP